MPCRFRLFEARPHYVHTSEGNTDFCEPTTASTRTSLTLVGAWIRCCTLQHIQDPDPHFCLLRSQQLHPCLCLLRQLCHAGYPIIARHWSTALWLTGIDRSRSCWLSWSMSPGCFLASIAPTMRHVGMCLWRRQWPWICHCIKYWFMWRQYETGFTVQLPVQIVLILRLPLRWTGMGMWTRSPSWGGGC